MCQTGGDDTASEPDHMQLAARLSRAEYGLLRQGLVQLDAAVPHTPISCDARSVPFFFTINLFFLLFPSACLLFRDLNTRRRVDNMVRCLDRVKLFPPEQPVQCEPTRNPDDQVISCCSRVDFCNKTLRPRLVRPAGGFCAAVSAISCQSRHRGRHAHVSHIVSSLP